MKQKNEIRLKQPRKSPFTWGQNLLVLIIFMGTGMLANAQLEYGVKLNGGISCQSDLLEIANNCDVRFSPGIGFIGKYQFTDAFALKTGLEYQQKGRHFNEEDTELSNKLQYLNIPLKAEFSAGEKAGFKNGQRILFAVGPYLSYLLDAEGKLNGVSFDLKEDTKDFDFGLAFEIGMEFPVFSEKALQIGVNYDMGFVEVYKSDPDLHNKMTSLSLGLLF